jgi:chromosome segregation ATPase
MMVTSLENASAIELQKRKDDLNKILTQLGSQASVSNEYNINYVSDSNIASSLIFNPLVASKFDNIELVKAVNVEITELMPKKNKSKKNLITKDIYDVEVQNQKDLQIELDNLNATIPSLNLEIDNLQIELDKEINEKLKIEQTQDVLQNQLNTLTDLIELYSTQIAQVVQKSTDESILRTSLESQNTGFKAQLEGLIKQIESLYSIINGLLNQIGAQIKVTKTQIFPSKPGPGGSGRTSGGLEPTEERKKYK